MRSNLSASRESEADIDAAKASSDEPVAALGQQVAVGGHREVFDANRVETREVVLDAVADERLAAGDADFADAQAQEDLGQTVKFGPREDFVVVANSFRVGGAAINTAKVATVRDGDTQGR